MDAPVPVFVNLVNVEQLVEVIVNSVADRDVDVLQVVPGDVVSG